MIRKTIDCLIAAVCIRNGAEFFHKDVDFSFIAQVTFPECVSDSLDIVLTVWQTTRPRVEEQLASVTTTEAIIIQKTEHAEWAKNGGRLVGC